MRGKNTLPCCRWEFAGELLQYCNIGASLGKIQALCAAGFQPSHFRECPLRSYGIVLEPCRPGVSPMPRLPSRAIRSYAALAATLPSDFGLPDIKYAGIKYAGIKYIGIKYTMECRGLDMRCSDASWSIGIDGVCSALQERAGFPRCDIPVGSVQTERTHGLRKPARPPEARTLAGKTRTGRSADRTGRHMKGSS